VVAADAVAIPVVCKEEIRVKIAADRTSSDSQRLSDVRVEQSSAEVVVRTHPVVDFVDEDLELEDLGDERSRHELVAVLKDEFEREGAPMTFPFKSWVSVCLTNDVVG
jgi:uncharacterized Fe-S cluster-containing protein